MENIESVIASQRRYLINNLNNSEKLLSVSVRAYLDVCNDSIDNCKDLMNSNRLSKCEYSRVLSEYEMWCVQSVWLNDFVTRNNINLKVDSEHDENGQESK